ncbi:MAG: hypothetical protein DWQ04_26840 [Chloroflexi bacterium]|nr:MAG: hypothetical protein DWQ04_26840 [Chloroflexota bacterium]
MRDWYITDLGFGINRSELENARNTFRTTTIGKGDYPALSKVFWRSTHSGRRIIILIEGDEAFVFDFDAERLDTETLNTFNRMLDSFEVYD